MHMSRAEGFPSPGTVLVRPEQSGHFRHPFTIAATASRDSSLEISSPMRSIAGRSMMRPGPGIGGRSFFHFSVETARGIGGSEFRVPSCWSAGLWSGTLRGESVASDAELGTRNSEPEILNSELKYTSDPPSSNCWRMYRSRSLAKPHLHRIEDGLSDFALAGERNVLPSTVPVEDRDPVGVSFERRSRFEGIVDHDEVEILAAELLRPLGLGLSVLEGESHGPCFGTTERYRSAENVLGRLQLDDQFPRRTRPLLIPRIPGAIVSWCRGHDQHVSGGQFFPHHSLQLGSRVYQ